MMKTDETNKGGSEPARCVGSESGGAPGSAADTGDATDAAIEAFWRTWPWIQGVFPNWKSIPPEPIDAAINAWLSFKSPLRYG